MGRTIPKLDWENACIQKNNSRATKKIDGVNVPRNGYAINVQWYKQKVVGVLEYVLDEYAAIVQSSSTLVFAGFDAHMHQVSGISVRVPRRRTNRSNRMIDDGLLPATINLQTTEEDWYRKEYGNVWQMNVDVRDDTLDISALI